MLPQAPFDGFVQQFYNIKSPSLLPSICIHQRNQSSQTISKPTTSAYKLPDNREKQIVNQPPEQPTGQSQTLFINQAPPKRCPPAPTPPLVQISRDKPC
jgi:hypothetical protein